MRKISSGGVDAKKLRDLERIRCLATETLKEISALTAPQALLRPALAPAMPSQPAAVAEPVYAPGDTDGVMEYASIPTEYAPARLKDIVDRWQAEPEKIVALSSIEQSATLFLVHDTVRYIKVTERAPIPAVMRAGLCGTALLEAPFPDDFRLLADRAIRSAHANWRPVVDRLRVVMNGCDFAYHRLVIPATATVCIITTLADA
jgi:hypothetical protein